MHPIGALVVLAPVSSFFRRWRATQNNGAGEVIRPNNRNQLERKDDVVTKQLARAFEEAKRADLAGPPISLEERRQTLVRLKQSLARYKDSIIDALNADFGGRSSHETLLAEIIGTCSALGHSAKHLKTWVKPRPCSVPWMYQPAKAWIQPQPRGVVGIISPWNYPVYLTFSPLASAIAAGNRVFLKLSEYTSQTSGLLAEIVAESDTQGLLRIVTGDADVAAYFSALPFDHILFTGSTRTGREVMRQAAENLTSVTLELGGKSPALIGPDVELKRIIDRIVFGKLFNAGQTCVSPDYVLVPEGMTESFVELFCQTTRVFFPTLYNNPDYSSIINRHHFERLRKLRHEAQQSGCRLITMEYKLEAKPDESLVFEPTLVINPDPVLGIMTEEIFGPILPVIGYRNTQQALDFINQRPNPLVLYIFTDNGKLVTECETATRSGAISVNETLVHAGIESFPLGGVGESGLGAYHGKTGFDTFSHLKPVFARRRPNLNAMVHPPYGKMTDRMISLLLKIAGR